MILNSPTISGSLTVTGNIIASGSITLSGSVASASFATSASNATNAISASYANNLTVAGTLTAQTLVVQTITSSVLYSSGSNVFGNNIANTQTFTGSVNVTGSVAIASAATYALDVSGTGRFTGTIKYSGTSQILDASSGTTGYLYQYLANTTGAAYFGLERSTGGGLFTDSSAYATVLGSTTATSLQFATNGIIRMTVSANGNVGIGTSSPNRLLDVSSGGDTYLRVTGNRGNSDDLHVSNVEFYNSNSTRIIAEVRAITGTGGTQSNSGQLAFYTNNAGTYAERMRIRNDGWIKISNSGTYLSVASPYHEIASNQNNNAAVVVTNSNNTYPYGVYMLFTTASPNDSTRWFYNGEDSTATRFIVRSNGGIVNYQANDTNLSDIRTKKDISLLGSYWNKLKALEIVKFKYKDQTHDDFNIGVIAQQVEEVAPEFVDVDGFGKIPEDGIPYKTIYTADLSHATIKVLQEAMAKIETLEAQNDALQSRIETLESK